MKVLNDASNFNPIDTRKFKFPGASKSHSGLPGIYLATSPQVNQEAFRNHQTKPTKNSFLSIYSDKFILNPTHDSKELFDLTDVRPSYMSRPVDKSFQSLNRGKDMYTSTVANWFKNTSTSPQKDLVESTFSIKSH